MRDWILRTPHPFPTDWASGTTCARSLAIKHKTVRKLEGSGFDEEQSL
jgi:hypothetical protein